MDLIALVIGFAIGVIVVSIAIEMSTKKTTKVTPASKHTKQWDFSEIPNPRIMAEYLIDAELPKDSKVVVNQFKNKNLLAGLDAKTHSGVRGNYIIGDDRVLILSGPMKKDEMGIWTVEKEIVERLNQEFEEMWADGTKMKFDEAK